MPPKIRVMKYTLVIVSKENQELLDRGLPYEKFLLGPKNSSAPLELSASETDLDPHRCIARLDLVHIHAARDHLVLTNPEILEITATESEALYESVKDILTEISSTIYRPHTSPSKWFIEANQLRSLSTVHITQAEGRNIDVWMPIDTDTPGVARQWRKWQNDIQMIWFNHPVNIAREANGQLSINSIWISGVGSLSDIQPHASLDQVKTLHSPDNCLSLIAQHLQKNHISGLQPPIFENTLSLVMQEDKEANQIWNATIEALKSKIITHVEIIDFPQGILRTQHLTIDDLPKKNWFFWKKTRMPHLEDILDQS